MIPLSSTVFWLFQALWILPGESFLPAPWKARVFKTVPTFPNQITKLKPFGLVDGSRIRAASSSHGGEEEAELGLNELHTRLRDAVIEQDFLEAGRISDIFLYKLHGDKLANGYSGSDADARKEKLRALRKRMSWKGLGAAPWLTNRLDSLNYTFPTTIQINAMEAANAILNATSSGSADESLEERIGRSNKDMGIVISGTTGSGKTLAFLVPMLSTLSDSLFTRQRIRVGAEEKVGDTTGDLLDRLAIVTSPVVRSTARKQIRSGSAIATGAALATLGKSGTDVKSPLALIVVPSRELGVQIAMDLYRLVGGVLKESPDELSGRQNMFKYKGPKGVRIGCVLDDEEASFGLKLQTDVAITTPKYVGKLVEDGDINPSMLRVIVYDEADLSLEMTPEATLKSLFEEEDEVDSDEPIRDYSRLTFLAGASVTEALGNLAVSSRILPPGRSYIATATRFAALQSGTDELETSTSEFLSQEPKASLQDLKLCLYSGLKHYCAQVDDDMGLLVLTRLLRKELREADESESKDRPRVMVFFPSEQEAKAAIEPLRDALWGEHRLCVLLPNTGISPLTILDQFRRNETSVMLATPNSVRGLDCRGLTHVYTLYLPMEDPREYVHLAGRVGRIGSYNGGNVISVLQKSKAHQMDTLANELGFEFSEIDTESLKNPAFSKEGVDSQSISVGDESGGEDVESMRRYLEDTINLVKLADDPEVVDVEHTNLKQDTLEEDEEEEEEDDDDDDDDDDPTPISSTAEIRSVTFSNLPKDQEPDVLCDFLMELGACSASITDADAGTPRENPVFGEPAASSSSMTSEKAWFDSLHWAAPIWNSCNVTAHFPAAVDLPSLLDMVRECFPHYPIPAQVQVLPDRDWVIYVQSSWNPIVVGDRFVLRFPWHLQEHVDEAIRQAQKTDSNESSSDGDNDSDQPLSDQKDYIELLLEGGVAFGTGEHATTQLCLEWLTEIIPNKVQNLEDEKDQKEPIWLMDYGSGSGILGMAACRLDSRVRAIGVDIDVDACRIANQNSQLNQVDMCSYFPPLSWAVDDVSKALLLKAQQHAKSQLAKEYLENGASALFMRQQDMERQYNVCVANILAGPLVALAPTLAALVAPGGYLGLSGILSHYGKDVVEAYTAAGFEHVKVANQRDGWVLVTGQQRTKE